MLDNNHKLIKNIYLLLKNYKSQIIISLLCTIVVTVISILMPNLSQHLMDNGIIERNMHNTVTYIVIIISLTLIEQATSASQSLIHTHIQNNLYRDLSISAFSHTIKMKMQYLKNNNFSQIISSISYDVQNIAQVADRDFLVLVIQIFKVIGGVIGLTLIHWKLAIIILMMIPLKFMIVNYLTKLKKKVFEHLLEQNQKFSFWYGDTLNGINEVKLWGLYRKKEKEFLSYINKRIKLESERAMLDEVNQFSGLTLENIVFNFLYIVGLYFIMGDQLTIGGLFAFIMYSSLVIEPVTLLINIKYQLANIIPSLQNYIDFLNIEEEQCDISNEIITKFSTPKHIHFENVSLAYEEEPILRNLTLDFYKGEKIAFIGSNGSGKTSLINLLLRFYEPTSGTIYMDGVNIQQLDLLQYRQHFSVMLQHVFLFNSSLRDNLIMGSDSDHFDHTTTNNKVIISDLLQFANRFPDQLDTIVGNNGTKLSGGERQKLGLARVMLKPGKILILDEATASYDAESEQLFNQFIAKCTDYDYVFVITHRPEILKAMDKIVVIEKGDVIQVGKYEEIVENQAQRIGG
ncbi:ABC transporter ATP-binding protein [Paenibacillus turicensis]|uniref:ABC transporter ATP-binding protein n=1 Tax=Paenibacillus turicensis TaxID=160487 RepID=UPI003D29477C